MTGQVGGGRLPRGIRNNNPGNLRRSGDAWLGLAADQTDPEFFRFETSIIGIRAMARVLRTYRRKYNLTTVAGIISRWAPAVENKTGAYVAAAAAELKVGPTAEIDIEKRIIAEGLIRAIIRRENGQQPYRLDQLTDALTLAGYRWPEPVPTPSMPMPLGPIARAPQPWLDFIARRPDQAAPPADLYLTPERMAMIAAVNREVNSAGIQPEARDVWDITLPGDCENLALAKRDRLSRLGLPRGALRLADGSAAGMPHAALILVTANRGDYVLNTTTPAVLPWRLSNFRARARAYRDGFWHKVV